MKSYQEWITDPTPLRMGNILKELEPTLVSESSRYGGGPVIKSKAKVLAAKAIQSYDPKSGAQLRSWVVTNLQPLARYRQGLAPVKMPEAASSRAAELNRMHLEFKDEHDRDPTHEELADVSGVNLKRVKDLMERSRAVISESALTAGMDADMLSGGMPAIHSAPGTSMSEVGEEVYKSLDPRSKAIYDFSTGLHGKETLQKTAIVKRLGVSPAFVSQQSEIIAKSIQDAKRLYS